MGNFLRSALDALASFWSRPSKIVIVGLDGAGKTTLLYRIKNNATVDTTPTIGFNKESFKYKNIEFTALDFGGQTQIRPMWRVYLQQTDALIFVVDASDRNRIDEAADELKMVFENDALVKAKLLVYANKQDLAGCMSVRELESKLNLAAVTRNPSHIQKATVTTGEGLLEGFEWLHKALTGKLSTKL
ncbi:hypothetical protein Poli38472_004824 [Pythium oligandrum]|uniref:ADP-ribosylation factor n=1 Tax=Pythium oligandrum TaxID=41045 RepID=A0A8K1CAX7_PYTOL|nr:hypothetical protein Poli38472_004824 [Pythium oligandrum]|eukprot:TMW59755.1 hypothetical protein Poli38472_004824 [Pythium oligandrum]